MWGHPLMRLRQAVGEEIEFCRKIQHSRIAVRSFAFQRKNTTGGSFPKMP